MTVYLPIVEWDTGAIAAEKILNSVNTKVDKSEYQEKIGQIEQDISWKADSSNVYNKTEVYNKNETYNKTEVDRAIPDVSDFITKDVENLSNYYKKTETYTKQETDNAISTAVSSVYKYKWSKENYSDLPSSWQSVGDTYNIINADETHDIKAGDNVSWNGTAWDKLAWTIDLSEYFNKEDNTSDNITEWTSHLMMTPAERTKLWQQSGINTWDQVASDFDVKDLQDETTILNTKTFYLANSTDLETAQAIYDWYLSGKNPIIYYSGSERPWLYVFSSAQPNAVFFSKNDIDSSDVSSFGVSNTSQKRIAIMVSGGIATRINVTDYNNRWPYVLSTNTDYSTPYNPQYDWSPATKKYVDDRTAVVSATAPSNPTQWQMRYDTSTNILKTYNWTSWNVTSNFPWMSILSYGNSTWKDFIDAYNNNAIVYCRASSNSNPATWAQTRMAFMAYVNKAVDPTEVEFQYYRSVSTKSDSQQWDQVYVYKLVKTTWRTVQTRNTFTKIAVWTWLTSTWSNWVLTISLA